MKIIKRLSFLLLLMLLAACGKPKLHPVQFSPADNSFSIMMPDTPKENVVQPVPKAIKGGKLYGTNVAPRGYFAGYIDFESLPSNHMSDNLDRARDMYVQRVNGTILSEDTIRLDGYTGRELRVSDSKGGIVHMRLYLMDLRLYTAQVASVSEADDKAPETDAFLNSFHLAGN